MDFLAKIFGWVKRILGWVDLAQQWLDAVEANYPGLVGIVKAIYDSLQDKINKAKGEFEATPTVSTEKAYELAKAVAREQAIGLIEEATSGSPRAIPEPILRAVFEMIVLKHGDYSYYEQDAVKKHALWILSKRG